MRIFLVFAVVALAITTKAFTDDDVVPVWTVAESTRTFTNNYLKTVIHGNLTNLITSSFSLQIALTMLTYGARGITANLLRSVLVLPTDDQLGQTSFKALFEAINATQGVDLRIVNKLFTSSTLPVKDAYKDLTVSVFSTPIQKLDFNNNEASARSINTWCEQQTNGHIKDLIKPADLNAFTLLVIMNVLYFKGKWDVPFDPSLTTDMPFYIDAQTTKNVSTMRIRSRFVTAYLPEFNASLIEIPYKGKEMSMIIVLPKRKDGLSAIVDNIDQLNLTYYLNRSFSSRVTLRLPKFEIETELDLKDTLQQMGLGNIFEDTADFSGMFEDPAKVTKVVQKAFIKVNEEGSEATVATGVIVEGRTAPRIFKVDHPAYYAIRHSATGTILLSGLLTNP